jgi:hypothetical protein
MTPASPTQNPSIWRQLLAAAPGIAAQLAAVGGNYGPAELQQQRAQLGLQQQALEGRQALEQSQLQSQDLQRQLEQKNLENYQTPEAKAEQALALSRAEKPTTYPADNGQIGIADTDLKGVTSPRMVTLPNPAYAAQQDVFKNFEQNNGALPATLPPAAPPTTQRAAMMPQSIGFHVQDPVTGLVYEYGKNGAPIGTQPGPPKPNVPLLPGTGTVSAMDVGAAGKPLPNPASYPQGTRDPQFRTDYQNWLAEAAAKKQQNAVALAAERGRAYGENRPLPMLGPDGTEVYGTIARGPAVLPGGQPALAGNQSGAASVAQKRGTFAELDQNLQNFRAAIPAVDNLSTVDRAAIVASLTPGKTAIGRGLEGIALSHLSAPARALVDTDRNLRQGVLSLRNVLTSGGVGSDYRINLLEAEMPNEQDFAAGNSTQLSNKLSSFESIYNDIVSSYPQLFTGRGSTNPARSGLKPPTKANANAGGKWNPKTLRFE